MPETAKGEGDTMEFAGKDRKVSEWIEGVQKNRGINAELTLDYCRKIEEYAKEKENKALLGFAYYHSGETYYGLNDSEKLFQYISKALTCLDESEQWELMAKAYNIMAIVSTNQGNIPVAMDYYLTGLSYCKKGNIADIENMINLNLGTIYLNNGQYKDALGYFEKCYSYIRVHKDMLGYLTVITCVYLGIGRCYLKQGMLEKAGKYCDKLDAECMPDLENIDVICVQCFKACYYHQIGREAARDFCIEEIYDCIKAEFAIMDVFDDLYDVCMLLLELDRNEILWEILKVLEELTRRANIVNLQRKIISLKIKYYRANGKGAEFLQAAGLHYQLTEMVEQENQNMIKSMMDVRNSLEQANEQRRIVEEANLRLQQKSETDQLTGLANRYRLNAYSENVFDRCKQNRTPMAVEILDIDYFKQYNDNYGHQAGDICISAIADELKKMQNERVFCARYGGDEFIIIYENMTLEEITNEAEGLRRRIMTLKMEHRYSLALPIVTVTQGICYDVPVGENKNWDFLHTADMMLYRVKKQCRNNICIGALNSDKIWLQGAGT